jgi:hypothetical protein
MLEGGIFDFSKERETSTAPASAIPQSGAGSVASSVAAAARQDAERAIPKRKYPRRSESVAGNERVTDSALSERVNAAIAAQLSQLHSPEAWGALACLPADGALVWTGHEHWKMSAEERKTLGLTCSAAAQTFMITNPRALGCAMALAAIAGAYIPRMLEQMRLMREAAEKKAKEKTV